MQFVSLVQVSLYFRRFFARLSVSSSVIPPVSFSLQAQYQEQETRHHEQQLTQHSHSQLSEHMTDWEQRLKAWSASLNKKSDQITALKETVAAQQNE
jgi:hypothetical protein